MLNDTYFNILDTVDSTNNYAMAKLHAGLAKHGMAWFTGDQTAGKGQRGKSWLMEKGKNIALSVVLAPASIQITEPFHVSAAIAVIVSRFFETLAGEETKIKWPNDIFWRDRKAGGILIENVYQGKNWKWAIAGIGININQTTFDGMAGRPVSLKQITGKDYDPVDLARRLHQTLLRELAETTSLAGIMKQYNKSLYKANQAVTLKKDGKAFTTLVKEVTETGKLVTVDAVEQQFGFGEVEWVF